MKLFTMMLISIFVVFSFQLDLIVGDYLKFVREGLSYSSHRKLKMKNEIRVLGYGPIATMLRSVITSFSDISVEMEKLFNSTKCQPELVSHDTTSRGTVRQLFIALCQGSYDFNFLDNHLIKFMV